MIGINSGVTNHLRNSRIHVHRKGDIISRKRRDRGRDKAMVNRRADRDVVRKTIAANNIRAMVVPIRSRDRTKIADKTGDRNVIAARKLSRSFKESSNCIPRDMVFYETPRRATYLKKPIRLSPVRCSKNTVFARVC